MSEDNDRICQLETEIAVLKAQRIAAEHALQLEATHLKTQVKALFSLLMLAIAIIGLFLKFR